LVLIWTKETTPVPRQLSLAEDIVPIGEFKTHASAYVRRVKQTRGPVVITQNGRAAAVVLSAERYEELEYRESVREAIREGIRSADEEQTYSLDEVIRGLRERIRKGAAKKRRAR
jgi:prevent-host-death family protein